MGRKALKPADQELSQLQGVDLMLHCSRGGDTFCKLCKQRVSAPLQRMALFQHIEGEVADDPSQIGEQIALGMSLLVMLIFATVITSFAATSTSREGDNFYHTKVAPVSVHTQLAAKFLMYVIVSALANGICAIVLFSTKQFDFNTSLWLFAVAESCSIALTLISMRMDINRPYFNLSGEGEVVNNNASTTLSVAAGFAVALTEGILCMLLSYLADIKLAFVLENGYIVEFTAQLMFYVCSGIAAALLIASIFGYLFRLKHAYNKIEK